MRSESGSRAAVCRIPPAESARAADSGAHASWRGNVPEDFPDYVDVAAAAPAKVNDYRALGYVVIAF